MISGSSAIAASSFAGYHGKREIPKTHVSHDTLLDGDEVNETGTDPLLLSPSAATGGSTS
jgi:hypothetical protein